MPEMLRRILLSFLIIMVLQKSVMTSEPKPSEILESMESIPLELLRIEEIPVPRSFSQSVNDAFINYLYMRLNTLKQSNETNKIKLLNDILNIPWHHASMNLWDSLDSFAAEIVPRCESYLNGPPMNRIELCSAYNHKSLSYVVHHFFRYALNIIRKGYSQLLQERILEEAVMGVHEPSRHSIEEQYQYNVRKVVTGFKDLAANTSTRIAACEPSEHTRNKTYLEMEKFLQGILPLEITLNEWNTGKGTCRDYSTQGTGYYPYGGIRSDGDWRCYGLMYRCFTIPMETAICKPTKPYRRFEGTIPAAKALKYPRMGRCPTDDRWIPQDWHDSMPFSFYSLEQCACICDDIDHPRTLRKFSRDYVLSDYKNNMVVTGFRFVNISNVIHMQVQEGKLEGFGYINSSSVHWRLNNNIYNRTADSDQRSSDDVVTLSYHKRRMNLDVFDFLPNEVVIGAAFDWTPEMDGVELTVFVTTFTLSTGELNEEFRKSPARNRPRRGIWQSRPNMPHLCKNHIPLGGDATYIEFRESDWSQDAAQTTVPYLDIQEVVTDPPLMLRGLGLFYKGVEGCGGYVALEIYTHIFPNLTSYDDFLL